MALKHPGVGCNGSHQKVQCGECRTILAMHKGDIPEGTLRSIVKALEPCLGKDWHKG
jgi:predicted RNA binding protein YcfA (HicA-like mRNA interferase family)